MLFDTHLHTKFSADSKMSIENAILSAKQQNIGLVLTEHLDYDFPGDDIYEFNPQQYFQEYSSYQSKTLYLGVEVGMQEHTLIQSKKFVESAPFDQVICSLHLLDGKDLFYESCYTEDKHTVYLNYLNTMIKLIKQHEFANILGHVDYICRYAPYAKKDICYEEFHDTIDTLWQTIIDKDIVPELNTRRFDNSNNISILLKLYERYAMLGGKYVSIGSDAHKPENIGFAFKEAYALLDKLNLQPVYFVNRQMQLIDILPMPKGRGFLDTNDTCLLK